MNYYRIELKTMQRIALLVMLTMGLADATIIAYGPECALIDYLGERAGDPHEFRRGIAIEALKSIALGRPQIPTVFSGEFKANVDSSRLPDRYVRSYAFAALGVLPDDTVLAFLRQIKRSDLPSDSESIWWSARIALASALTLRIKTSEEQLQFLTSIADGSDSLSSPHVRVWAADELCNRGAQGATESLRRAFATIRIDEKRNSERLGFCSARVRVLSINPDRDDALGSAVDRLGPEERELLWWALRELQRSGSARAQMHLRRFDERVKAMPRSATKQQLEELKSSAASSARSHHVR